MRRAHRQYQPGEAKWVCAGSPENGYTCRGGGKPPAEVPHPRWSGPSLAEQGCLMCQSRDMSIIHIHSSYSMSGDSYWSCEAYCNTCGWYSRWAYTD